MSTFCKSHLPASNMQGCYKQRNCLFKPKNLQKVLALTTHLNRDAGDGKANGAWSTNFLKLVLKLVINLVLKKTHIQTHTRLIACLVQKIETSSFSIVLTNTVI